MIFLLTLIPILIFGVILFGNSSSSQSKAELTILEAIKLANLSALKWDENAQLLTAVNIDLEDKAEKLIGSDGKRKYWNISFGVPDTNKFFLVTIHKGEIKETNDLTNNGDSPFPKKEFIAIEDINYDSPQLLKKALKLDAVNPGNDWAKGYNFMIRKDPETDIPLLLVIGWNKELKSIVSVYFDATDGNHLVTSNPIGDD